MVVALSRGGVLHRMRDERLRSPAESYETTSYFIERAFGETRRRVKVIGRLPGETSCLTLVWAVLDRASRGLRRAYDPVSPDGPDHFSVVHAKMMRWRTGIVTG
jgi:hypothetical protein